MTAELEEHGFRVIAVDLAGHGRSPRALRYSPAAWADDVVETLEPLLDGPPDVVMGHSLGGLVASLVADRMAPRAAIYIDPAFSFPRGIRGWAFKLFFDWVGQYDLVDTPVLLTATGGSDRHALLVEHQMRPLFGFFQSTTLPLGVFGNERDFAKREGGYDIASVDLELRIDQAVRRALPIIRGGFVTADAAEVRRPAEF